MSENKSGFISSLFRPKVVAFIKFGLTGVSGLAIDFLLTWIFKDKLIVNKFVANGIGFTTAVASNYLINKNWTFKGNKGKPAIQFTAFFIVSVIGLALNSAIIFLLNTQFNLNFYLSKAVAIFIVFFWNFSANYFFVFKKGKE